MGTKPYLWLSCLVVLVGCARADQQGLLPGRAPAPAGGLEAGAPVDGAVELAGGLEAGAPPADAAAAAAPDAEQFPSCSAIGFSDQVMFDCDEPPPSPAAWVRRTPDQRWSCARCAGPAGEPTARSCAAKPRGPGLPWLCVASCSSCPFFDCTGIAEGSPCKLAGFPDGGTP
jgi:hypothetical protein